MQFVRAYLIDGLDVSQIVAQLGVAEAEVREQLRTAGIAVPADGTEDAVTIAAKKRGFSSFVDFVRNHQSLGHRDKARALGVTRSSFARLYDVYRRIVSDQHSSR